MAEDHGLLARWKLLRAATRDGRLSRGDVACLGAVLDRINGDTGTAWPSLATIATDALVDRRTVARAVARLVELGYLERESGNRTASNRYAMGSAGSGELVTTGSGEAAPTPSGESVTTGSGESVTRVVASSPLGVVAGMSPELAYLNLPTEPAQLNLTAPAVAGDRFPEIWKVYPRKDGKAKARQLWTSRKLDAQADKILADLTARIADPGQWEDPKFIPHASTYLGQQRWLDEWKPSTRGSVTPLLPRDTRPQSDLDAANAQSHGFLEERYAP